MADPTETRDPISITATPQPASLRSISIYDDRTDTRGHSATDISFGASGVNLELTATKEIGGGHGLADLEKQKTKISIHDAGAFPDGGKDAWLCVVGGFFCMWCSFGEYTRSLDIHTFTMGLTNNKQDG